MHPPFYSTIFLGAFLFYNLIIRVLKIQYRIKAEPLTLSSVESQLLVLVINDGWVV